MLNEKFFFVFFFLAVVARVVRRDIGTTKNPRNEIKSRKVSCDVKSKV